MKSFEIIQLLYHEIDNHIYNRICIVLGKDLKKDLN